MCKSVADQTETSVAHLAARLWFVGSGISLVACHRGPPWAARLKAKDYRQLWREQFVGREGGCDLFDHPYLLALAPGGRVTPTSRQLSRKPHLMAAYATLYSCMCASV
jgi:hypothetical protein